ncbi:MAG TPA: hypothetical protein VMF35_16015 [Acidimicrobiales bacterium]|nr:hypothetical protein [Acidimicrobiales bacterium]
MDSESMVQRALRLSEHERQIALEEAALVAKDRADASEAVGDRMKAAWLHVASAHDEARLVHERAAVIHRQHAEIYAANERAAARKAASIRHN